MADTVAELYRVMDVFDDPTFHQVIGRWPKVGDLVRVVERCANRNAVFAESNGGNYNAFFLDSQVRGFDDFLNLQDHGMGGTGTVSSRIQL